MKLKCFGNRIEDPLKIDGKNVCTATHPKTPKWSGQSRGRKIHLAKDNKFTICNMLIDEYVPANDTNWSPVINGKCGNCFEK